MYERKVIDLPFTPENRDWILEGRKSATTRRGSKGKPGDIFLVRSTWYVLRAVVRIELRDVALYWHREEGFELPTGFSRIWAQLHPRKGWVPDQRASLHIFTDLDRELWP